MKQMKKKEVFKNISILFTVIFFCSIWVNEIKYYNIIGNLFFPLIIVLFLFLGIINNKIQMDMISSAILCTLLLFFIETYLSAFSTYQLHFGQLFSYILMYALLFLLHQYSFSSITYRRFLYGVLVGALIIGLNIIIFKHQYFQNDNTRLTVKTISGELVDPNFIGSYLTTACATSLFLSLDQKKIRFILIATILMFSVFLTGSRGAFIYFLIISIGFVITVVIQVPKTKQLCIVILVLLFFVFPILGYFLFSNYYSLINRLVLNLSEYTTDASNQERIGYWMNGLKVFIQNPLLGQGIVRENEMFWKILGVQMSTAHNTWLTLLNQVGLLGLFFFLFPLLYTTLKALKKKDFFIPFVILGFIVNVTIISAPVSYIFWIPYIVFILIHDYEKTRRENAAKWKL